MTVAEPMTAPNPEPWWRRPLTPRDHARIRQQLFLIPIYMWLAFAWWQTLTHLPIANPSTDPMKGAMRDFAHFYAQGVLANAHDARGLYDTDTLARVVSASIPGVTDMRYPPVYGPQVALLFAPLARLSYDHALYIWVGLTVAIFVACGWLLLPLCPRIGGRRWAMAFLLAAAPTLHVALGYGQASALGLVCVTGATLAFAADRPWLAGVAIGSLAYKPPLGIAAAVVMVFWREWRVIGGAMLAAAAQLAAGVAYWGVGILPPYMRALRELPAVSAAMEPFKFHMHSWRPFFQLLGLPEAIAFPAYLVAAALTLAVAVAAWRPGRPLAARMAVLLLATMLVDPHLYVYDLLVLTPGLLLLWDWAEGQGDARFRWGLRALLAFCYVMPLLGPLATVIHVQLTVVAMSLLSVAATWPRIFSRQGIAHLIH